MQRSKKTFPTRLAHKEQYKSVERTPDQQIDLLIVVDQMLTGFDSKWINTLYLDKVLVYEKLIQAFSRTNRLFGPEKPFGTIRYYRKPIRCVGISTKRSNCTLVTNLLAYLRTSWSITWAAE